MFISIPVKHGLVTRVIDWPYSTFHGLVERVIYQPDWAGGEEVAGLIYGAMPFGYCALRGLKQRITATMLRKFGLP